MKLYVTQLSPFARMARIVVIEKGLQERVEVILAQTRTADSPYYRINPSGRVPYLVRDDGVGMEESELICAYLGGPQFAIPASEAWEKEIEHPLLDAPFDLQLGLACALTLEARNRGWQWRAGLRSSCAGSSSLPRAPRSSPRHRRCRSVEIRL